MRNDVLGEAAVVVVAGSSGLWTAASRREGFELVSSVDRQHIACGASCTVPRHAFPSAQGSRTQRYLCRSPRRSSGSSLIFPSTAFSCTGEHLAAGREGDP